MGLVRERTKSAQMQMNNVVFRLHKYMKGIKEGPMSVKEWLGKCPINNDVSLRISYPDTVTPCSTVDGESQSRGRWMMIAMMVMWEPTVRYGLYRFGRLSVRSVERRGWIGHRRRDVVR